jgi:hypothetical protein
MGMLKIKREADTRVTKCILHRVADIPGGVSIDTSKLGGATLKEGTPLGKGSDGLYLVVKTAVVTENATSSATDIKVAKGHHFLAGDKISNGTANAQTIASIDKSNASYDVITVSTTLGAALTAGNVLIEANSGAATLAVSPIAVAGSSYDVAAGENLFVDAWLIAVVKEDSAPAVSTAIKTALKTVVYV